MTTRVTRPLLGLATAATLITAAFGITACTASNSATAPATTIAPGTATPNPGALVHHPTTSATASTTATTRTHAALTTTTPTTAPGTPPATTATTGSGPATTDSPTPTTGTPSSPTITYRVTNTDGPLVTLTTNGAVYIIRGKDPIPLAPALVVDVTTPPDLEDGGTHIEAAISAFRSFADVVDRAVHDPRKDWRSDAEQYAVDPVLKAVLAEIDRMATHHIRSVGHVVYRGTVSGVSRNEVQLHICNDNSGLDDLDAESGISIRADDGGGLIQDVTVALAADGRWLVSHVKTQRGTTC